ncbi:PTS sugar transporter subunit IIA [Paenibacillus sedimenti]|uniref:PTS glucose transporter subunit IIA n=1 Tax=Paenibacillus sedimenti TaxID=2770274 RepID=A0A926QHY2_9BACL|nr:PTS glucose transporter subunit IIA [Paenibacillus sedimenti]MBD0378747.1 PTS glucose transporter subunit IIA [Paenibacillus sedimenti]
MKLSKWLGIKKGQMEETIWSPLSGKVLKLADVPDPVFSSMPPECGIAIDPAAGRVLSPIDGEVVAMLPSKHAVVIRSDSGVELIIHIGLDTVSMKGEGFHAFVRNGDRVTAGQPLIDFSPDLVMRKATSTITPVFIMNPEVVDWLDIQIPDLAQAGITPLMKFRLKRY